MSRLVLVWMAAMGCGGGGEPAKAPAPVPVGWIAAVKPWYCGPEALPPRVSKEGVSKEGVSTARTRDIALKIVPGTDSFTAIWAAADGTDSAIGSLTRFTSDTDGTATLRWENDRKQKGEARLAFAPDFATVTVTWTAEVTPPGSPAVPPAPTTLTYAPGPAACVAGGMLR